jgi:adenylate cyclase
MKISIKFSILSILLTLLIGTYLSVISIDHFTIQNILVEMTKNLLNNASGKASEQIARYFQPIEQSSNIAARLIKDKIINPGDSPDFANFLHAIIEKQEGISAAYWGDEKGNFFLIKKAENNQFFGESIIRATRKEETKDIENTYDDKFQLIQSKKVTDISFDPRIRPWYQETRYEKKHTWYVYPLLHFGAKTPELGITSVFPVYDESNNLQGIFGLDMPLQKVAMFIKTLYVTKNSAVFIVDEHGHVLSAYTGEIDLLKGYKMPNLADLKMAWVQKSFDLYSKNKQPLFIYNVDNKDYIAVYKEIPGVEGAYHWQVAIVTPVNDITQALEKNVLYSLFLGMVILAIGILLATILSSRISKPIIKLANDADLICQLKLEEIKWIFSYIKEISFMTDAFMKMKSVLQSFQRYMPITLIKDLLFTGKIAAVGGEIKEITLLFSDIENFTPLSETMAPEDLMLYLSEYFQVVTNIIISHHGTVDKYLGDGLMAFWGAPLDDPEHALHACQAVLAMQAALKKLNEKWRNEGKPELATRIGINTGRVVVGNVGSDDRLNYTALGDAVNLASRLESLNKVYHTYTLASEFTMRLVKDRFKFRFVAKVAIKGKMHEFSVYELLDM